MSSHLRTPTAFSEIIKTGGSSTAIKKNECRRYRSALQMSMVVSGVRHTSNAGIIYEVKYRDPAPAERAHWSQKSWYKWLLYEEFTHDARYDTPESVRAALMDIKPRHAFVPAWNSFNFDRVVQVLGGMLAALSVTPSLGTSDFRGGRAPAVKGLNQANDMHAVLDAGAVFVHNGFSPMGRSDALWALVNAINLAGATVVLLTADCDGNGAPLCQDVSGGRLVHGILAALGTLAGLYSLAGVGDAFGVALIKGLHSVLSLVGHSDEGGFMRDVLRSGGYAPPHGGIPQGIVVAAGIPAIQAGGLAQVCGVVDSMVIASGALVAHCDPTDCVGDDIYPTVIRAEQAGNTDAVDGCELVQRNLSMIASGFTEFSNNYARALSKLFGLSCSEFGGAGASALEGFFLCMCRRAQKEHMRHLAHQALVPYFWVEPTSVLPRHYIGTRAEQGGIGSLAGWHDRIEVPFLPGAAATGAADHYRSHWVAAWRSLRTWPGYIFLANHHKDGVAHIHLKNFDCESVVLAKETAQTMYACKQADGYIDPGRLAWVRGQSAIPHPGEALNTDGTVGLTLWHRTDGEGKRVVDIKHIPPPEQVQRAVVCYAATPLTSISNGPANEEPSDLKRHRTRGLQTLEICRNEARGFIHGMVEGLFASERPPPRQLRHGIGTTVASSVDTARPGAQLPHSGGTVVAQAAEPGGSETVLGVRAGIARQHGVITAPQPRISNTAQVCGGAQSLQGGDERVEIVNGATSAAEHSQSGASATTGATPAQQ